MGSVEQGPRRQNSSAARVVPEVPAADQELEPRQQGSQGQCGLQGWVVEGTEPISLLCLTLMT